MLRQLMWMGLAMGLLGQSFGADPTISVAIQSRYPWSGMVDLNFAIAAEDAAGGYADSVAGDESIPGRRLKYVRSTGDVQLNTGVVVGSKNTIEMKFEWEDNPSYANECLFCARGSTGTTATYTGFIMNGKWRFDYNSKYGTESSAPTLQTGVPMVIRDVAGTASVNGTLVQTHTAASFTVGGPLTLFASYIGSPGTTTDNYFAGKIYYLKIYDDDGMTLLHDFVPWEKDGLVGLYDLKAYRFVSPRVGTLLGGTKYNVSFTAKDLVGGTNITMKTLLKSDGSAATVSKEQLLPGNYHWVWDAMTDLGNHSVYDPVAVVGAVVDESTLGGVQLWENGPYWAEANLGASKPEGYGYYFWWGDIIGYTYKSWDNWVASNGTVAKNWIHSPSTCPTSKGLDTLKSLGYVDSSGKLTSKYDAGTVHLGGLWRMPTGAEFSALISNCTSTWTTRNSVKGRLFTGKGSYASKSVFFPAAGYGTRDSDIRDRGGLYDYGGYYWASTVSSSSSKFSSFLSFASGSVSSSLAYRCSGFTIRPVR